MTPSKEVLDAARKLLPDPHSNDELDAFIAGDSNGYSRAMERINELERVLKGFDRFDRMRGYPQGHEWIELMQVVKDKLKKAE